MDDRLTYPLPSRTALAAAIETLVHVLDLIDGDPDLESIDEREPDDEEGGHTWTERIDQSRHPYGGHQPATIAAHEDAEDDDPLEDDDPAGGNVTDEPHDPGAEDGL